MELEKNLVLDAPPQRVWELLLDPQVMGGCVPGIQSIEVIGPTEYVSVLQVRIAFVAARLRIRTTIAEQRAPHYLRTEGSGEDASVASSFRQGSEVFLDALPDGRTAVRMAIKVDVLGRLGTFGLGVMKTKADRMWDEFGANLAGRVAAGVAGRRVEAEAAPMPHAAGPVVPAAAAALASGRRQGQGTAWWARLFGARRPGSASAAAERRPDDICIELRREGTSITVLWPAQGAPGCADWLRQVLR